MALAVQAAGKLPPCNKVVSAELGCVTPCIIVPGPWTAADLEGVADEIVSWLVHNAGHNCLKVEVLVTDASWPLRGAFNAAIKCAPALLAGCDVDGSLMAATERQAGCCTLCVCTVQLSASHAAE